MNRIDLLLADLKAKAQFRKVMTKHAQDFAPKQQEVQNVPTPNPGNPSPDPSGQQAQIPPGIPSG